MEVRVLPTQLMNTDKRYLKLKSGMGQLNAAQLRRFFSRPSHMIVLDTNRYEERDGLDCY